MSIFKILTLNRILNEATHKDFDLDKINVDDPSTYPMWTNGKPMTKARVLSLMAARDKEAGKLTGNAAAKKPKTFDASKVDLATIDLENPDTWPTWDNGEPMSKARVARLFKDEERRKKKEADEKMKDERRAMKIQATFYGTGFTLTRRDPIQLTGVVGVTWAGAVYETGMTALLSTGLKIDSRDHHTNEPNGKQTTITKPHVSRDVLLYPEGFTDERPCRMIVDYVVNISNVYLNNSKGARDHFIKQVTSICLKYGFKAVNIDSVQGKISNLVYRNILPESNFDKLMLKALGDLFKPLDKDLKVFLKTTN